MVCIHELSLLILFFPSIRINAPNWIGIDVEIDGKMLDLHTCELKEFRRELNMRHGYLERSFTVLEKGKILNISVRRFLSMKRDEIGAIR